jgi:hypothetical protein
VAWVAALYGAYQAYENNREAGKKADQQQQVYGRDLSMRQNLSDQEKQLYGPLESNLLSQASSNEPMYYGQTSGQINKQFGEARRNLASQEAVKGMTSSNLNGATGTGLELSRMGALGSAFQQGLTARTQLGTAMVGRYNPLQLAEYTSGGLGQLGNFYGQQANLYGTAAAQGWQNFGNTANALQEWYDLKNANQDPTVTPSGAAPAPTAMNMSPGMVRSYGGVTQDYSGQQIPNAPVQPGAPLPNQSMFAGKAFGIIPMTPGNPNSSVISGSVANGVQ